VKRFVKCFYVVAILVAELCAAPPSAKPTEKQAGTSDSKKAAGFLNARIAFAGLLDAAYHKLSYFLRVQATGPDKRTLELHSVLMSEGSHTMEAALEVLTDADVFANVKHSQFTKIVFSSDEFSIEYSITNGIARRIR
jgi:hypothetical protein